MIYHSLPLEGDQDCLTIYELSILICLLSGCRTPSSRHFCSHKHVDASMMWSDWALNTSRVCADPCLLASLLTRTWSEKSTDSKAYREIEWSGCMLRFCCTHFLCAGVGIQWSQSNMSTCEPRSFFSHTLQRVSLWWSFSHSWLLRRELVNSRLQDIPGRGPAFRAWSHIAKDERRL